MQPRKIDPNDVLDRLKAKRQSSDKAVTDRSGTKYYPVINVKEHHLIEALVDAINEANQHPRRVEGCYSQGLLLRAELESVSVLCGCGLEADDCDYPSCHHWRDES